MTPRPHGSPLASAWDAQTYDRISLPHAAIGAPALERLELRGDERVLDAGCGSAQRFNFAGVDRTSSRHGPRRRRADWN